MNGMKPQTLAPKEALVAPFANFDSVARTRARVCPDKLILSYPIESDSDDDPELISFHDITWARLERLTRVAAFTYARAFSANHADKYPASVRNGGEAGRDFMVAQCGVSSLDAILTFLALRRLGYCVMMISPRLADTGFAHLLRQLGAGLVVASGPSLQAMERVRDGLGMDVGVVEMLRLEDMLRLEEEDEAETGRMAIPELTTNEMDVPTLAMHTGGTTGLPKAVKLDVTWLLDTALPGDGGEAATTRAVLSWGMPVEQRSPGLSTLPIFHSYGMIELVNSLGANRHQIFMSSAKPITVKRICAILDAKQCKALSTVPYILKFFVETPGAVERLSKLNMVMSGGSATPQDLGDVLVRNGVKIVSGYGQTESGFLMTSTDDLGGHDWNWLRPLDSALPHMEFEPVYGGREGEEGTMYHLVLKASLKSRKLSDRPDGSYGTKDLFVRHPKDPNLWRFMARYDDIIVLVNGEKADPHPLESCMKASPYVETAVAFGAGQDSLGMIVIPSQKAEGLSKAELVQRILPNLELGNARMPAWAKLSTDALIIKDIGTPFPMTDKSTVIRPQFLRQFDADIKAFYAALEQAQLDDVVDIADEDVINAVRGIMRRELGTDDDDYKESFTDDTDFFSMGMDSLQATNVRAKILRRIPTGGRKLPTNVVFDNPTVKSLTTYLIQLRRGDTGSVQTESAEALAHDMVQRYSNMLRWEPGSLQTAHSCFVVVLTGATGFIGKHVLGALIRRNTVTRVYCLVRASSHPAAEKRILASLEDARLLPDQVSPQDQAKIVALASDLSDVHLGLSAEDYGRLRDAATHIIHNAWAVNFNMALSSFEKHCVAGTAHLLQLALSSPFETKPAFTFVSSVASVMRIRPQPPKEKQYPFSGAISSGYGQSKWVGEQLCAAAVAKGLKCRVIRVGQVSGDTRFGRWNTAEAIPTTIQSARTLNALPAPPHEEHCWLPVDVCGAAVSELALLDGVESHAASAVPALSFFHVASTDPILWTEQFLPVLARNGLPFEPVAPEEWLRRLENSDPDVRRNPARKLLEHFKMRYGARSKTMDDTDTSGAVRLDVVQAKTCSPSLARGTRVDETLMSKYLAYWREVWTGEDKEKHGAAGTTRS